MEPNLLLRPPANGPKIRSIVVVVFRLFVVVLPTAFIFAVVVALDVVVAVPVPTVCFAVVVVFEKSLKIS